MSIIDNSCCVTMLAAFLVLIFFSQTPVEASRERPYCSNTSNQCQCCEAQNEKFHALNDKLDAQNEKLDAQNEKLEDLNEKFETLVKQKQEQEHNCKLELDGELKEAIMVINTTAPVNISVRGSSKCTLRVLAVGGGGGE